MQARIDEPRVDNFYNWVQGQTVVSMIGKTGEVIPRVKADDLLVRVSRRNPDNSTQSLDMRVRFLTFLHFLHEG